MYTKNKNFNKDIVKANLGVFMSPGMAQLDLLHKFMFFISVMLRIAC